MFNQNPSLKGGLGCLYIGGRRGIHVLPRRGEARRRLSRLLFMSRTQTRSRCPVATGCPVHRMSGAVRISGREITEGWDLGRMSGPKPRFLLGLVYTPSFPCLRLLHSASRPSLLGPSFWSKIKVSHLGRIICSLIFEESARNEST